jgi:heptosyltransferase-3
MLPMSDSVVDFAGLRRALVIKLRHHGDVLLSAPVLSALQAAAPGCEIDALVYADTAPMLAGHPALSELHGIDRGWKKLGPWAQLRAELQLLRTLRARRYDLVIHLTEHRRGAWLVRLLGPRWSVAPRQKGRGGFWKKSFSHFYAQPGHALRHTVEKNLDALRVLGIHPVPAARRTLMVPGAEAQARVDVLLQDAGVGAGRFIQLHPASRWLFKCWPAESMAMLADALHQRGHVLVVTAAPDPKELALVAAIRERTRAPLVDLSGQLSLRELAALTARARLFVGVDSAPMHIAAAVGTPAVALFGPSGDKEWGPWMTPHRIVTSTVHSCRPCGLDGCGGSKVSDCLVNLPVSQVLAACEELLG